MTASFSMNLQTVRDKQRTYLARLEKVIRLGTQEFAEFREYKRIVRNFQWENLTTAPDIRLLEQASALQRAIKIRNLNTVKEFCEIKIEYYLQYEKVLQSSQPIHLDSKLEQLKEKVQRMFDAHRTTIEIFLKD